MGPVWRGGGHREDELLARCYRRCLEVARDIGAETVAFPAISTGVYGFPVPRAAKIAVATVHESSGAHQRVRLVAFDRGTFDAYRAELVALGGRASRIAEQDRP